MHDSSVPKPTRPKGLKTLGVVALAGAAIVVATGIASRSGELHAAQENAAALAIPTVHLVAVKSEAGAGTLTLPGTLEAWTSARIYPRVPGYISAWYHDIGTRVGAGAPLGRIDTPDLDQQIAQARAALVSARANAALAKSTAARWTDLLSTNSVSKQETDERLGDLAVKNAAILAAQANLGRLMALKQYATVRAPFAGVVTQRNADIGNLVGPGATQQQPMFAVADTHRIRAYVNIPQSYARSIHAGQPGTLTLPEYPDRRFPARVLGDANAINSQSGTLQVELVADNADGALKPGGYAQVSLDPSATGGGGGAQIPASALIFRAAGAQVATIDANGHAHLHAIKVARDLGPTIEVASGVQPGERIVDNPPDSLAEGQLVRVGGNAHG